MGDEKSASRKETKLYQGNTEHSVTFYLYFQDG